MAKLQTCTEINAKRFSNFRQKQRPLVAIQCIKSQFFAVLASFLVNMIADGVTFSFGVLFDELEKEFGESKAVTAGVVSLFHAVPLLSGPVASALTDR